MPLADHLILRNRLDIEKGLEEMRGAGKERGRLRRDAGRGHVEEEKAYALVLGRGRIGSYEAEDPVRLVGVAGPDLLAVDEPMVALVLTLRLERSEVVAGIGLRIALAPAYLPPRDLWEKPLLLLLGAVFKERRPQPNGKA